MAAGQRIDFDVEHLDPDLTGEECAGLLLEANSAHKRNRRWHRHLMVGGALTCLAASLALLVLYGPRPRAMMRAAVDFETKSEFTSMGKSMQPPPRAAEAPEQPESSGASALMDAIDHLTGEDVLEEERREKRQQAEALAKAKAAARAAALAEKKAREKRLREQRIVEEMERRAEEQEQAERRVLEQERERLEEERRKALEEQRRKAAIERAKQLQALREREEREAAEARRKCLQKKEEFAKAYRPTLYCIALMMPFGYEPGLVAQQQRLNASLFACDGYEVISNTTTLLPSGDPLPVNLTAVMNGSLAVKYGGRWGTAMNTGVFNRVWTLVVQLGRYRHFDWTVKVDPDAVFFPHRLRNVLMRRAPMNSVRIRGPVPANLQCGQCQQLGYWTESCPDRVRSYQRQNKTCAEALHLAAREPPFDCGCSCDDFACDVPEETAMYINNCKWGLHGPIEIFSRKAVAAYIGGLSQCSEFLERAWGEDKFIDQCLQKLNITRVNEYDVLSELACGEQPSPCKSADVAFHPFKSIDSYFTCHNFASRYGKGPEDLDCNIKPRLTFNEAAYMK